MCMERKLHVTLIYMISDDVEVIKIRENAGFSYRFVNETIKNFRFLRFDHLILKLFFDVPDQPKTTIETIKVPVCDH